MRRVSLGAGGNEREARQAGEERLPGASSAAAPSTTSTRTAPSSIAAAPSVIASPCRRRVGHPVGRQGLAGARRSTSSARSAAATTSSSCSAARRPGRSSCRSTPAAAASATASRRTTSQMAKAASGPTSIDRHRSRLLHAGVDSTTARTCNAVAAGGNFAIVNRLVIFEQIAEAFREGLQGGPRARLRDQPQPGAGRGRIPSSATCWVHRKGATRAFPGRPPRARRHALGGRRATRCSSPARTATTATSSAPEAGRGEERATR